MDDQKAKDELISIIKDYLSEQEGLLSAYLFGSVAEGMAHQLSDVDVALLLSPQLDSTTAFALRLEVMAALKHRCHRSVDVVILNDASPLLRFQVIQRGQVLLERDRTARCLFEARTMSEYYDTKRYLDYHLSHVLGRIEREGLGAGYKGHRDALEEARRLSERLATLSADSA